MARTNKPRRPRAETPKGFRDYFGAEVTRRSEMLRKIAEVYERYGFDALESPAVETVEALGKFLPDVDRPNEGVFAWQEDDDWLALRYDLTAPLARVYAQHRNELPTPYRRYAMGPVWRNEKPGPGRFRQFYQCDADTVGAASVAADAEMCALLCDTLEAVGIPRGDYVVRVNNRKVLNGVLGGLRRSDAEPLPRRFSEVSKVRADEMGFISPDKILRTIDKFDKVGPGGLIELLTEGRKDQSGAFIEGVGLSEADAKGVLDFLLSRAASNDATLRNLRYRLKRPSDDLEDVYQHNEGLEGVQELEEIADLLAAQGYGPERIIIDPSVVRGLGYYTGPVFEAELTFETLDEKGRPRQFGSVAGGGRYDDLVKRFTGQAVPATGVSIGVDRLLAALAAKEEAGEGRAADPLVVVTVMDRERMAEYQRMAAELRGLEAGGRKVRAEVYLGNPKNFGNQLKYADRRGAAVAVIQGADEAARGVVQVKDLVLGARIAESASLEEWKAQPAQREVPRDGLAAEVRRMLDGS